jgi:hypothetical protein
MRLLRATIVAIVCFAAASGTSIARDPYGNEGLHRRYSPYDRPFSDYRREPPNYAPSRRAVEPFTPYYNRPAVWPYYPVYYGSWGWGPYGYRYGFSPWFAPRGPARWPNAWRIAPIGPAPFTRFDYSWRVPFMPYEPGACVDPHDVGRGIPATLTAEPSEECYYW